MTATPPSTSRTTTGDVPLALLDRELPAAP